MDEKADLSFQRYWKLLFDYIRPQRRSVILLSVLILGNIGLQLINPQIIRYYLDTAEASNQLDKLMGAAAIFVGVAIANQLIQIIATYVGENLAWIATNALRADLALHCLKLDMTFHKKYKPGELIERVDGDVNQLANFFSQLVVRLGGNLLLVIGVLVLLALFDWRLGVWITIVALLGMLSLDWLNKRTIPRWQAVREADARLFGLVEEWLNGTEEIRTNAAEPFIMRGLYQSLRQRWQKILAAMRIQVLVADLPLGVFALAYTGAHIVSNTLFRDSLMTIGQVYLIFYYLDILKGPLWDMLRQVQDLQRAAASINRVAELRQVQPALHDGPGWKVQPGPLAVAFTDLSFHYEDDPDTDVLKEISLQIRPGTVLGLLGRTGSGKSTLTKLLFRFYDPTRGGIRIGNGFSNNKELIDIRQARQSELRNRIGMVTQEVQIFQASLRHNLTVFDEQIPDARILAVIEEVGLGDWFENLPSGLDTLLESAGGGMSAGEAQLLAFARVLLTDPGLVILDEASSRLDKATEGRIEKAIDRLLQGRTGIIIAHRLSTVERADEIMILEDGQIAEHGSRLVLAKDPSSLFYHLLQTGLEEVMA
jgi:ATP-binding cassette subfamily B protein